MSVRLVRFELQGITPLSFSKPYEVEKLDRESPGDYEKRTCWERLHRTEDGKRVKVPIEFVKMALDGTAAYLGMKLRGRRTFRQIFESAVSPFSGIDLDLPLEAAYLDKRFVSSEGLPGGGKRVFKYFPEIAKGWKGVGEMLVFDGAITETVFEQHLVQAGIIKGLGRFRPAQRGTKGRFKVLDINWRDYAE